MEGLLVSAFCKGCRGGDGEGLVDDEGGNLCVERTTDGRIGMKRCCKERGWVEGILGFLEGVSLSLL